MWIKRRQYEAILTRLNDLERGLGKQRPHINGDISERMRMVEAKLRRLGGAEEHPQTVK